MIAHPQQVDPHRSLDGVRVVDLSRALAGPYATMMLADVGADVLKIEPPTGDDSRGWLPFVERSEGRESAYFLSVNRGKRSACLDLKTPEGVARLRALCADADVLVENYRPGLLARLGLDPASLGADNPRLVTLSITGFGVGGPDGHRPGFDQIVQAEAGLMSLTGPADGEPTRVGLPIADLLAGMFGAFGVMSALRERETSGIGRVVETSLLAAVTAVHAFHGAGWLAARHEPARTGNRHPSIAPYGTFRCRDATLVIAVGSEALWRRFAPVVGIRPDRPDLATNHDRVVHVEALQREIDTRLADRRAEDVLADLLAAGVPAGRIRTVPEVYEWEQVRHLDLVHQVVHPTLGSVHLPGGALRYDGRTAAAPTPPPAWGGPDRMCWEQPWLDQRAGCAGPGAR